jgi:transposase-like protein
MIREIVQETVNGILDAEADRLCDAGRYEHAEARTDQRTGHERHEDKASGFHRKSRFRIWSQGSNKS